jgi:hypothetical protein
MKVLVFLTFVLGFNPVQASKDSDYHAMKDLENKPSLWLRLKSAITGDKSQGKSLTTVQKPMGYGTTGQTPTYQKK